MVKCIIYSLTATVVSRIVEAQRVLRIKKYPTTGQNYRFLMRDHIFNAGSYFDIKLDAKVAAAIWGINYTKPPEGMRWCKNEKNCIKIRGFEDSVRCEVSTFFWKNKLRFIFFMKKMLTSHLTESPKPLILMQFFSFLYHLIPSGDTVYRYHTDTHTNRHANIDQRTDRPPASSIFLK